MIVINVIFFVILFIMVVVLVEGDVGSVVFKSGFL